MSIFTSREYEFKPFEAGQFYKLATELINFKGTSLDQCNFRISYTVEDMSITDSIDIDKLSEIKLLGKNLDLLAMEIGKESIKFYESHGDITVLFSLSLGIEKAKEMIALTESILNLSRIEKIETDETECSEDNKALSGSGEHVEVWKKTLKILRRRMENNAYKTWM
ncbi:hypothetical protein [Desulfitobacterium sp.]|uniref:hypothetical protein n=1 Tax=Desulfitobacterium sp. TaxID=49981 RepID=UPI002B1F3FEF|nr:hypothetical protein [Desulfitobacterium sp.]MEA4903158.1 hypothetical protein [Desulfitobacterium sp.]